MTEVATGALKPIPWDGHKITKPGMYSGIPIDQYHGDICDGPSASSSSLRTIFGESPDDYWKDSYLNPARMAAEDDDEDELKRKKKEQKQFIFGRAAHHLFLGEQGFGKVFVEQPATYRGEKGEVKPWSNNANVCKAWNKERAREGKTIITAKDLEHIVGMAKKLGDHPLVKQGVLTGLVEQSLFWRDKKTGIWLKARPDVIPTHSGEVTDYKTTQSVQLDELTRTIGDYGYHQQAALIAEGLLIVLGIELSTFTFIFQRKTPPYSVREVFLKDEAIVDGAKSNRYAIGLMADCLKTGKWPGPGEESGGQWVDISDYRRKQIELRLSGVPL